MIFGQNPKTNLGLEFTPTITSLAVKPLSGNYDPRISFSTGLNIERFLNSQISLKAGLNYERKGSRGDFLFIDEFGNLVGTREMKINSDYLTLPVMISSYTKGKTRFYMNAGPFLGFLIRNKALYSAIGDHPEQTIDITENMKRIDLGFSIGFGLYIPIGDVLLLDLGIRDNMGLLNTSKEGSVKTNSYGFQLGVKYSM